MTPRHQNWEVPSVVTILDWNKGQNPLCSYPAFSYLYVLPAHYPLAAALVPQPKAQLLFAPCLRVHSSSNLWVWPQATISRWFTDLKALAAGWPLGWPSWEETRGFLLPDTVPSSSTTDPSLGKAEPIRHGCGASVEMYLRAETPGQGEEEGTQQKWLERRKEQRDGNEKAREAEVLCSGADTHTTQRDHSLQRIHAGAGTPLEGTVA